MLKNHPDLPLVQLDTVIGRVGGKVILTIHFVNSDFMIGILLENKTATEVANKIQSFKMELKSLSFAFGEIAPLLLTDNGGEFSNVSAFEDDIKTVQQNLGHATASFTLDVYGHVSKKMKQESADRMQSYFEKITN